VLQETQRLSWQLIWREEMSGRFASSSKPDIEQDPESATTEKTIEASDKVESAPAASDAKSSVSTRQKLCRKFRSVYHLLIQ
jgi:hypothetical protein